MNKKRTLRRGAHYNQTNTTSALQPVHYASLRVANSQPEITSSPQNQENKLNDVKTSARTMTMVLTNLRRKTLTAKSTLKGNMQ